MKFDFENYYIKKCDSDKNSFEKCISNTSDDFYFKKFDFEQSFRFSVDKMLAFLAKKLRILGFDTYLRNDDHDLSYFIQKSILEKRFIISSSYKLLTTFCNTKRYKFYFNKVIFINSELIDSKLVGSELNLKDRDFIVSLISYIFSFLFKFYNLDKIYYKDLINFINQNKLSRCLICNKKVIKKDNNFYYCIECDKLYWEGCHHKNINNFINSVITKFRY
ncbi:MAG: Mut7-C RNAse domain-containing protein [bacterium]|jgi:uncharacterized protein with PIN domain